MLRELGLGPEWFRKRDVPTRSTHLAYQACGDTLATGRTEARSGETLRNLSIAVPGRASGQQVLNKVLVVRAI